MKNWIFIILGLFLFTTGCSKRTTPKMVKKRITEGTWKISVFVDNDVSIAENYNTYTFAFTDNENIEVAGLGFSSGGSWSTGLDKNPAILYLNFPPNGGLEFLADDWKVLKITKDIMELTRNQTDGDGGSLIFRK